MTLHRADPGKTSQRPKVLVIARDAGAGNALAPVARALIRDRGTHVSIIGYTQAADCFKRFDLPLYAFETEEKPDGPRRLFDREQPDFLLTGTSMKARQDGALWSEARRRGIPSLAVLDHWGNYWQRFTLNNEPRFGCTPDRIAVMDNVAYEAMIDAGCPSEKLIVTGQPFFDDLVSPDDPDLRIAAREDLGIEPGEKLVLFASEPLAKHYGTNTSFPSFLGYTEDDVMSLVLDTLQESGSESAFSIIVKLHPLEGPERLETTLVGRRGVDVRLLKEFPLRRLIAAADVVTGITSVFLLGAVLMGRPAISIQPVRLWSDGFIESQNGLIELALTQDDLKVHLASALAESDAAWQVRRQRAIAHGFDGQAARRIAGLVGEAIGLTATPG